MSNTTTKQRVARYVIGFVGVLIVASLVIYSQRNSIAMSMLERRLDSLERRMDIEFSVSSIEVDSFTEVNLGAVEIAHGGRSRVRVDRTRIVLESPSFALKAPKPMTAKVEEMSVSLDSQGSLAGLISDL